MNATMGMQLQAQQQQMNFLQNQNVQLVANQQSQEAQKGELDFLRNQNKQLMSQKNVQKSQQDQLDFLLNQNRSMQELQTQQIHFMIDEKVARQQASASNQHEMDSRNKPNNLGMIDQQQDGQEFPATHDLKRKTYQRHEPRQDQLNHLKQESNFFHNDDNNFQQPMTTLVEHSEQLPSNESNDEQQITSTK
jgi:hypothetical protein